MWRAPSKPIYPLPLNNVAKPMLSPKTFQGERQKSLGKGRFVGVPDKSLLPGNLPFDTLSLQISWPWLSGAAEIIDYVTPYQRHCDCDSIFSTWWNLESPCGHKTGNVGEEFSKSD